MSRVVWDSGGSPRPPPTPPYPHLGTPTGPKTAQNGPKLAEILKNFEKFSKISLKNYVAPPVSVPMCVTSCLGLGWVPPATPPPPPPPLGRPPRPPPPKRGVGGGSGVGGGVFGLPGVYMYICIFVYFGIPTFSALTFTFSILGFLGFLVSHFQRLDVYIFNVGCFRNFGVPLSAP